MTGEDKDFKQARDKFLDDLADNGNKIRIDEIIAFASRRVFDRKDLTEEGGVLHVLKDIEGATYVVPKGDYPTVRHEGRRYLLLRRPGDDDAYDYMLKADGSEPITFEVLEQFGPLLYALEHPGLIEDIRSFYYRMLNQMESDEELNYRLFHPELFDYAPIMPTVPKQDTIEPRNHLQSITKTIQSITDNDNQLSLYEEGLLLDVASAIERRAGKEVTTSIALSYEGDDVTLTKEMTKYDKSVYNTVSSMWAEGARVITPRQVFSNMTGSDGKPSGQQLEAVTKSLRKMSHTFAKLDFTDEMRGREATFEGSPVTSFRFETRLLEADETEIENARGDVVSGFIVKDAPILYKHAAIIGQVVCYPQRLLVATNEAGRNTEANIIARAYIFERIEQMKNKRNHMSCTIATDTLYREAGIDQSNRDARKSLLDYVRKVLDILRSEDYIRGYSEKKGGRYGAITSITIHP